MEPTWRQVLELRRRPGALAAFGIGVAVVWLVVIGALGAVLVSDDDAEPDVVAGGGDDTSFLDDAAAGDGVAATDPGAPGTTEPVAGNGDGAAPGAAGAAGAAGATGGAGSAAAPPPATAPGPVEIPSPSGGDSTGVTATEIKIGVHGPFTVNGVPLNLAEDPIKGIETYAQWINENGGIHGRKLVIDLQTDDSGAEGSRAAANTLINDHKNFMVSGTLGIDQIAIVAAEAAKRGVPYTAAGGNENRPIPGMFQLSASYNSHVAQLADYLARDPKYKGRRVGILVSDSEFIRPVADEFKERLERNGMPVSTVVKNQKPQTNPDYNAYILEFRRTNTEVVVPLTDPVTTSQIVQRCAAGAACGWTYSFTNFAHDSDTALALMSPTWGAQRVRGLASVCYFRAPEIDDAAKCAQMAAARDQYVALRGRAEWDDDGSGAVLGFQIVNYIKGGLAAAGADLTRERFTAALRAYDGYSDLVSGPISYAATGNIMHGATKMAVYEAQPDKTWKMISPGLMSGF